MPAGDKLALAMIPEIDIWRAASLMLKRYGEKALEESAARADELFAEQDHDGAAVWRRIIDAVGQFAKMKPSGRPHRLPGISFRGRIDATVAQAVADQVKKQVECGIDIVSDGEMSKAGFFTYIRERLEGFESRPNEKVALFQKEVSAFPEYYEQYFKEAMLGGALAPLAPVVCVGPVKYVGEAALRKDIANLKAAAKAAGVPDEQVFMPATAASGVGRNEYYKTEEEYFH